VKRGSVLTGGWEAAAGKLVGWRDNRKLIWSVKVMVVVCGSGKY